MKFAPDGSLILDSVSSVKEEVKRDEKEIEIVSDDDQTLPKVEQTCEKCGNTEAYFWLRQTRAGDEPETKFYKCTKCSHTWRDYT